MLRFQYTSTLQQTEYLHVTFSWPSPSPYGVAHVSYTNRRWGQYQVLVQCASFSLKL